MSANPYQAPQAAVADHVETRIESDLLVRPRAVPAAQGWAWIASAWSLFKQSPVIWFVVVLLALGVNIAAQMLPYVGVLAGNLVVPFLFGLIALLADGIRGGRGADLGRAFGALSPQAGRLAVLGAIYVLSSAVLIFLAFVPLFGLSGLGMLTGHPVAPSGSFWTALLIEMVLAIPVAMATYFAPTLVVLHGKAPLDAMRLSFAACLRNIPAFLVFTLCLFGLAIVATLPLGLGWFVLMPVLMITVYAAYRDIFFEG